MGGTGYEVGRGEPCTLDIPVRIRRLVAVDLDSTAAGGVAGGGGPARLPSGDAREQANIAITAPLTAPGVVTHGGAARRV